MSDRDAYHGMSVIVVTHNRRDDLAECLTPLTPELLDSRDAEVIVVDDASKDGTSAMLAQRFPWVSCIRNETNTGPASARNIAAAQARGNLLVFLDSDAVPGDNWLDTLAAADDGATVLIGRLLDYRTGAVQYGPRRATFLGKSLPSSVDRANTGPTANLAVPRMLFDRVGGFDPDLPYYFEDSWLCIRLARANARFRYLTDAAVRHKGGTDRRGEKVRMQENNSTFAMLKLYADRPLRRTLFSLANGLWVVLRMAWWPLVGRAGDAAFLWKGWRSAYHRFAKGRG